MNRSLVASLALGLACGGGSGMDAESSGASSGESGTEDTGGESGGGTGTGGIGSNCESDELSIWGTILLDRLDSSPEMMSGAFEPALDVEIPFELCGTAAEWTIDEPEATSIVNMDEPRGFLGPEASVLPDSFREKFAAPSLVTLYLEDEGDPGSPAVTTLFSASLGSQVTELYRVTVDCEASDQIPLEDDGRPQFIAHQCSGYSFAYRAVDQNVVTDSARGSGTLDVQPP